MTEVNLINEQQVVSNSKIYIILFTADVHSPVSKLVSTRSKRYTHVGISINENLYPIYDLYGFGGIRVSKLDEFTGVRFADIYSIDCNDTKLAMELIHGFIKGKTRYNFLDALNIFLKTGHYNYESMIRNMIKSNKFICSSFVALILYFTSKEVREYLEMNMIEISTITPDDLLYFPTIKFERRELIYNK